MEGAVMNEMQNDLNSPDMKENISTSRPQRTSPSPKNASSETLGLPVISCKEPSIEQLYDNVCEMKSSSNGSLSQLSVGSGGEESRLDSELCHLAGGEMKAVKTIEAEQDGSVKNVVAHVENGTAEKKQKNSFKTHSPNRLANRSRRPPHHPQLKLKSDTSMKPSKKENNFPDKDKNLSKLVSPIEYMKKLNSYLAREVSFENGTEDSSDAGLDNPDLGPFLLKHSRDLIASNNAKKALKYALRAAKSFERCAGGKPSLDLVMSLHVIAAIYCNLAQYGEAVPVLQQSIEIPVLEEGQEHAVAKFSGYMMLGDTHSMLGHLDSSIQCYTEGLELQKHVLGDMDARVGETCRYLAEVYLQALQFDEAERLCQRALDIHREKAKLAPLEEAADRRLMGLICDIRGDYEAALEHLVLASMSMVANGLEKEVASVNCSIGDIYVSLSRYDEAVFAYQKALTVYKTTKGVNHPAVASVFARLAELYNRIGKTRESKSYCESALRIYSNPIPGISSEEIAIGLTNISSIYESMNEHEEALSLLQQASMVYRNSTGQKSTIAGIEAQIGALHYIIGNYDESYFSLENAITDFRACGEKKSAFLGFALNQMGLACLQRFAINEAAELFQEARSILEKECGPFHVDTLGVCSNLAVTYDAMGRLDEAIEILDIVVRTREEKLGTANPDVEDEKRRLTEMLEEAGRVRSSRPRSPETLLGKDRHAVNKISVGTI